METQQQTMVSSFLEIAVDQTPQTAIHFLQAASWRLEEAIHLFYVGHECNAPSSYIPPPEENDDDDLMTSDEEWEMPEEEGYDSPIEEDETHDSPLEVDDTHDSPIENDENGVSAPIPVKREILYGGSSFEDSHAEEKKDTGVWAAKEGSTSAAKDSRDLASLYRPPFALMYNGSFEMTKQAAHRQDRWLLVNVQCTREFNSHMLNRDTWADEAVAQTITNNFIFWQIYDDTEEGSKICTYYKLDSLPVTLVLDPITGQKMRLWRGMIQPASLLEDLVQFMDDSPKDQHLRFYQKRQREITPLTPPKIQEETSEDDDEMRLARELSVGTMKESSEVMFKDSSACEVVPQKELYNYPPLPEEPKGDKSSLCRVGVRLPSGRRLQRNFLRSDPIQLLWSFCAANCNDEKPLRLTHAIPGAMKDMEYGSTLTFDEAGVANSVISVTWKEG